MPRLTVEPHAPVASLDDLSALAARIDADAAAAYGTLAARMRRAHRPDLAGLFETLEEEARRKATGRPAAPPPPGLLPIFDDEGLAGTAPERASAYGAFAMAVRNARRAFSFWTYVAAHSPAEAVRQAAEELARDALARTAALRHQRRLAYHRERTAMGGIPAWTPESLERRLAALLQAAGLDALAGQALARAEALGRSPLGQPKPFRHIRPQGLDHARPLAELLLDGYLDLAERLPTEETRGRAQLYTAQLLDCLSAAAAPSE